MIKAILAATFALAFAAAVSAESASQPTTVPAVPAVGDAARDFTLDTPAGKAVQLSTLIKQGPVVLIVLRGWPGYQCPICTRQVGDFIAHQKELAAAGAQVLLVYPGPADQLKAHAEEFIEGKGLPAGFHLVIDPDFTVTSAHGLRWDAPKETAYPSTFVIDRQGVIRFAQISKTHGGRAEAAAVLKALSDAQ